MKKLLSIMLLLASFAQAQNRQVDIPNPVVAESATGQIPTLATSPDFMLRSVLTATNNTLAWDMSRFQSYSIQINNFYVCSTCTFVVQASNDNKTWSNVVSEVQGMNTSVVNAVGQVWRASNAGATLFGGAKRGKFMRIQYIGGAVIPHQVSVVVSSLPYTPQQADLAYSTDAITTYVPAPGGIVDTNPVVVKAASSPAFKQGIAAITITNGGTGGAEYYLQDGTSTTYLYRGYINAWGVQTIKFPSALFGSYGNSIQFGLVSASNMKVYPTIQFITSN